MYRCGFWLCEQNVHSNGGGLVLSTSVLSDHRVSQTLPSRYPFFRNTMLPMEPVCSAIWFRMISRNFNQEGYWHVTIIFAKNLFFPWELGLCCFHGATLGYSFWFVKKLKNIELPHSLNKKGWNCFKKFRGNVISAVTNKNSDLFILSYWYYYTINKLFLEDMQLLG